MTAKIRILSALYVAFLLVLAGAGGAGAAQDGRLLDPPRTPSGEAYLDAVRGKGLQTDISYRTAEAEVDEPDLPENRGGGSEDLGKTVGWILLGLLLVALAVLTYRSRNALSEMAGPRGRAKFPAAPRPVRKEPGSIDHDLIERLRAEPDPREGLRLVLQRILALVAEESSIPVKRSLTTREIMQRLPGGLSHRDALETLASEVERVVFAGQSIEQDRYQYCLSLAVPFLRRTAA